MTEYVVPMGTPVFFHVATPVTGAGYTWVGTYPYIDTADLGGSYGEINNLITGDPGGQWVGSVLPAYVAPAGITGARVDLQINMPGLDSVSHGWRWNMTCDDVTSPWDWASNTYLPAVAGWNTIADTYTFDPTFGPGFDISDMVAALATGSMNLVAHQAQIDVTFQVSQLRLTLIGGPPEPNLTGQLLDNRVRFT